MRLISPGPFPEGWGRRAAGLLLVLLLHALLGLLFLTLAPVFTGKPVLETAMLSIDVAPERPQQEEAAPEEPRENEREEPRPPEPDQPPPVPTPVVTQPPVIVVPPEETTALAAPPAPPTPPPAANRPVYGPPDLRPRGPPDSERVEGAGPNGEPLYAARWYREPYDDELRGYLSTARGPGWGLIACRTVRDYRIEDCAILGEYPVGSGIANAVLAASWQFRVRPPQIGGEPQVGEWVRIRIDYERQVRER
jgi:protein TonB